MGQKATNFLNGLSDRASTVAAALALSHSHAQLQEIMAAARAAGVQLTLPAITPAVAATQSVVQIAQAADVTNFITITDVAGGVPSATGLLTIAIADAAGVSPTCTMTAGGVLGILLGTTDANNTLTAIKAIIDVAATGRLATKITGTAGTTMAHAGANTYVAAAPGAAAGTGVKSSVAGTAAVAATRTFAIATI